jgi:hypothetical protein
MLKKGKLINLCVLCVWIVLLGILLYKDYRGAGLGKIEDVKQTFQKKSYWYDVYANNKKIGFANTTIEQIGNEILFRHQRELKAFKTENGIQKEVIIEEKLEALCNPDYSTKSFKYSNNIKGEKGISLSAKTDKDDIIFELESADKRKIHTAPLNNKNRNFYIPITLASALQHKKPPLNTVLKSPILNFSKLTVDDSDIILQEIMPVKIRVDIRSIYKFKIGNSVVWTNDLGVIIKSQEPSGLTLYLQTENIAQDPSDRTIFDYTSLPFFKSNMIFSKKPEEFSKMKIKIDGIKLHPELYKNTLITLTQNTLIIKKDDAENMKAKTYPLPNSDTALSEYLKDDKWIRINDKTIAGNAKNMVIVEKNDAFRMARYLTSNLYFTVSPMALFTLSDSLDIFKTHLGDYVERTMMFASFARASGLPTRMVSGLVYKNGYFYFHTWPEVWFSRWIPVDPSLAQFPADVTHIPLKQGTIEDLISIVDDLKKIKIEVLEAS